MARCVSSAQAVEILEINHDVQAADVERRAVRPVRTISFVEEVMTVRLMGGRETLKVIAFLLFFAATVFINLTCSKDSNPTSDPSCGSGHVTWDAKAQRCRDQANNQIVPNSCCGQ